MFFNEVTAINETRKQFTDLEAGLKEVIRYCMLTEFGNDEGSISWTGEYGFLKSVVDMLAWKGFAEGQARAAALPPAPAALPAAPVTLPVAPIGDTIML